jgi:hypothetical protein
MINFSQLPQYCSALLTSSLNKLPTQELYKVGVIMYCFSAIIELLSEHLYLHSIRLNNTKTRVIIEASANIFRCISTYLTVLYLQWTNQLNTGTAIVAYSIGQFGFSFIISLGYFGYYWYHIQKQTEYIFCTNSTPKELEEQQPSNDIKSENNTCLLFSALSQLIPILPQSYSTALPPGVTIWDSELIALTKGFGFQSLFKHFLTEGEKMILVALSPFDSEQNGAYALVMNLGGLFTRLVLQPLEENSHQMFSNFHRKCTDEIKEMLKISTIEAHSDVNLTTEGSICVDEIVMIPSHIFNHDHDRNDSIDEETSDNEYDSTDDQSLSSEQKGEKEYTRSDQMANSNNNTELHKWVLKPTYTTSQLQTHITNFNTYRAQLLTHFKSTILISTTIGLILSVFGPPLSYTAIRLIYGTKWSDDTTAPAVLAVYSVAQLFFALNGIYEGFMYSTISTKTRLSRANIAIIWCSIGYCLALVLFVGHNGLLEQFGTQGLIIANIFGMSLRILYSSSHIKEYFNRTLTEHGLDFIQSRESDLTIPSRTIITWRRLIQFSIPSIPTRWFLFLSLILSHFASTFFLFPTIQGFDDIISNVFWMGIKSKQIFMTDNVPYNEPRSHLHTGPKFIQYYSPPQLTQHIYTILFILPFFAIFVIFFVVFDKKRISFS